MPPNIARRKRAKPPRLWARIRRSRPGGFAREARPTFPIAPSSDVARSKGPRGALYNRVLLAPPPPVPCRYPWPSYSPTIRAADRNGLRILQERKIRKTPMRVRIVRTDSNLQFSRRVLLFADGNASDHCLPQDLLWLERRGERRSREDTDKIHRERQN